MHKLQFLCTAASWAVHVYLGIVWNRTSIGALVSESNYQTSLIKVESISRIVVSLCQVLFFFHQNPSALNQRVVTLVVPLVELVVCDFSDGVHKCL